MCVSARHRRKGARVNTDRIDFISAYCDRWCERCRFTSRCSSYAVEIATGMCGDFEAGLELAIGTPCVPRTDGSRLSSPERDFDPDELEGATEEATAAAARDRERRREDERSPMMIDAQAFTIVAWRWLNARMEQLSTADTVLQEALAVAAHDAAFIAAKLARALHGRREPLDDEDRVQNDSNGSAKVALISVERSEVAWRVVAQSTGEATPTAIADALLCLKQQVEYDFPDVRRFIRPGFDEPWR